MKCLNVVVILWLVGFMPTVNGQSVCGGVPYSKETQLCCDGLISAKTTVYDKCCGWSTYDSRTHVCETGKRRKLTIEETMKCHSNGTIEVTNDDSATFIYAAAMQGTLTSASQICTVDMSNNPLIVISGCTPNKDTTLFLSTTALNTNILGGWNTSMRSVKLHCTAVPEEGVNMTIGNFLSAEVTTPLEAYSKVPKLFLDSRMWFAGTTDFTTEAILGQQLTWGIRAPDGYSAMPVQCTAYSGTNTNGSPSKVIILNGCSMDESLIGNFIKLTENGLYGLCAQLWVFSFHNSPNVFFHCTVKICQPGTAACDYTCGDRKRRAVITDDEEETLMEIGVSLRVMNAASNLEKVQLSSKSDTSYTKTKMGWLGGAKVSCILRHRGVQLILAYSWARPAILVAGGLGLWFGISLAVTLSTCSSRFTEAF